ncbi:hypothetical protein L6452_26761 [Arctium lappa]|uniref:Uncharacterized protein n=1 Tax=Arctium lappa TaxID=4217 RepID=A0ACB8ZVK5_ARCLA|nr:hypothetical protein L6452_26761 [Arctium lappa]
MAGPSNPPPHDVSPRIQDLEYLYASNANVSNFVSVKLSGNQNYHLWKTQMLCLMETHDMRGLVDATFDGPRASSMKIMKQYDSLLKGWIFGSVNTGVLDTVVDLGSAKQVWDKLKSFYAPIIGFQQDSARTKLEAKEKTNKGKGISTETKDKDMVSEEKGTKKDDCIILMEPRGTRNMPKLPEPKPEDIEELKSRNKRLEAATMDGAWREVRYMWETFNVPVKEAIDIEGNTVLHLAVGKGHNHFVRSLLEYLKEEEVAEALEMTNVYGSTALHVAAVGGNTYAATLLVKTHEKLLTILDKEGHHPLFKAHSTMQLETCRALVLVENFPEFARENDEVLMAIARTFPSGLSHEEIYPDLGDICEGISEIITTSLLKFVEFWSRQSQSGAIYIRDVSSMKHLKKKEWEEAKQVLKLVCHIIDTLKFSGTYHPYYEGPFLEAARQNAHEVVDEILKRSPHLIRCKDKCGYNIIQLAVIHRSDKIYNLVYQIGDDKNQSYKTIKDSSENNMLHLAGRLAPSHKLNRIAGAALQLQRELQWHEELKNFVFPAYITQENIYNETPGVVFTREHENLLKEGEEWMKITAESCSITAGLITTIVFAAAITVPGGSNQEKGIPLFTHEIAFIIFAISDAVSLFTSTITLLVFLSILTARFSEKDFLVSLPSRLIIGLCALLVSTTAMMVAFGATLFLVFCHQRPWMLVPICASTCLTIVFFLIIQFPLIVDLYQSTYVPIFGKKRYSREDSLIVYVINKYFE